MKKGWILEEAMKVKKLVASKSSVSSERSKRWITSATISRSMASMSSTGNWSIWSQKC